MNEREIQRLLHLPPAESFGELLIEHYQPYRPLGRFTPIPSRHPNGRTKLRPILP